MTSFATVTTCWMIEGGCSTDGERIDGVFEDFGVALALLGRALGVSDAEPVGVFALALGVRFMDDFVALGGATGGFSTKKSH